MISAEVRGGVTVGGGGDLLPVHHGTPLTRGGRGEAVEEEEEDCWPRPREEKVGGLFAWVREGLEVYAWVEEVQVWWRLVALMGVPFWGGGTCFTHALGAAEDLFLLYDLRILFGKSHFASLFSEIDPVPSTGECVRGNRLSHSLALWPPPISSHGKKGSLLSSCNISFEIFWVTSHFPCVAHIENLGS